MKTIKDYNSLIALIEGIVRKQLLMEGGAAGHMRHPFDLDDVVDGPGLIEKFKQIGKEIEGGNLPDTKVDGSNNSIKVVDDKFVADRGSQKELDIIGTPIERLRDRFKPTIDPVTGEEKEHGMVKSMGETLEIFNDDFEPLKPELKKLGVLDDPTKFLDIEYVKKKEEGGENVNVLEYDHDFLKIHGVKQFYEKHDRKGKLIRPGLPRPIDKKTRKPTKEKSTPIPYDQKALDSLAKKVNKAGEKHGFGVYSLIPSKKTGIFDFDSVMNVPVPVTLSDGSIDEKTLGQRLQAAKNRIGETVEINDLNERGEVVGTRTPPTQGKEVYVKVLGTDAADLNVDSKRQTALDRLVVNKEDYQKAIDGAVFWHATRLLGNVIMDNMEVDHPAVSGPAKDHEGLVLVLSGDTFKTKITGEFILRGIASPHRKEGDEEALSFVFIPGGFKPPHKGHISLIEAAVNQNPGARIIVLSGKEPRSQGRIEVTADISEKIFRLFLEHVGLKIGTGPGEVDLIYFEPIPTGEAYTKTSKRGKVGEPIMTSSPMVKIGEIAVNEAENGAKIVIISSKADENYNKAFNNILAYAAEKAGKTFEVEAIALKTEDAEPGVKISATDMRRAVEENDFEKFKQFLPDGFPEDQAGLIFKNLGGQFETEQPEESVSPQEPQTDMDEASGTGGVAGPGHRRWPHQFVRGVLQKESTMKGTIYNMQESKLTREEEVLKEFLVERFIKQYKAEDLLKEGPGERVKSTFGVAQMTQGLNKILDQVYNQHYFNLDLPEQRESFIAHFIEYAMGALAQVDVLLARRRGQGEEGPAEESEAAVEAAAADIEVGDEAAEAIAEEPVGATELEEAAPEGEEKTITLDVEDDEKEEEEASAEDILSGKKLPEISTELPPEIASMNAQGAAQAQLAFHNNGKQLIDAYRGIVDPNPGSPNYEKELVQAQNYRAGFKDSFLTNFGLWSDRWKIQTDSTAQARTTPDLEAIRKERDATVVQPGGAAAPAAPALEEAQMADIIKQSIIKTFRKLDYK